MKIITLIENTSRIKNLISEHGLSLYIETAGHHVLFDTGADSRFISNAQSLGVDLQKIDTVILSHGHYDHCGGVWAFAELNPKAKIYISAAAFKNFWLLNSQNNKYIGIDKRIASLPQLVLVKDSLVIDEELFLFSGVRDTCFWPSTNNELKIKIGNDYLPDDFNHEQYLEIRENGKSILLSGCAHCGIVNILERYRTLRCTEPDAVISGFHTMNNHGYSQTEKSQIAELGKALRQYKTQFYTCHCTGVEPYQSLKKIMSTQISYLATGEELTL